VGGNELGWGAGRDDRAEGHGVDAEMERDGDRGGEVRCTLLGLVFDTRVHTTGVFLAPFQAFPLTKNSSCLFTFFENAICSNTVGFLSLGCG
jgi:hypothetical protein